MEKDEDKTKILSENLFPVVGVGASSGGLEAFRALIRTIPEESGMAYILVQHLHPEYKSTLPEILQRETSIPVLHVVDNVRVQPDHIYIIPSNKLLVATDGILQLSDRPSREEKKPPIDVFFTSLAEVHQTHAIGVILSGTGMDGTAGLKSIKEHGGLTIVQDPTTTEYDGMPISAIQAGVVDFVLAPENIASEIQNLVRKYNGDVILVQQNSPQNEEMLFRQILALLRIRKTVDFTYYKQTTIRRRILRRMVINKIERLGEYYEQLKQNKGEQDTLFQDLLIPVSSFFRDEQSFELLCTDVFPELFKSKSHTNPLRIWVAGCSTGQEAYTIAMCMHEYMGDKASNYKIQIFATDISETAISFARVGIYPKKDLENISTDRLNRFFVKTDGHYQIRKTIRDMLVFAHHNFLKDPPFAKLDLITCRNVLIYMEPFLQKKGFSTFHYALKEKGFLMLGKSESPGHSSELFIPYTQKDKIYIRKAGSGGFTVNRSSRKEDKEDDKKLSIPVGKKEDLQKVADNILLSRFSPPGVIVNEQYDIVQFRGSTGLFLEPSPGKASLNVLKMAKKGLTFEIRNALHKASAAKKTFIKTGIPLDDENLVSIEVIPMYETIEPHFLILFNTEDSEQITYTRKTAKEKSKNPEHAELRITQLEKDLAQAREDMRTITEEQEAANEELQSANEELLSSGEELQSLNEELETSKEELQSTNEELITINQELFDRNEQFNQARLYAEAIVTTIHEPLLVLNYDFKIWSANRAFYNCFNLNEEDIHGRTLFDIQDGKWNTPTLHAQLLKIRKKKADFVEWDDVYNFPNIGEKHLRFNVQPIVRENSESLILLAIDDITIRKLALKKMEEFSNSLEIQVQERTASLKLLNLELQHSNKNLEQYASIASHDLQEPLRKIQTFAMLLNQRHSTEISPKMQELLEKIVSSSERMATLIKDVLNFSRISHPEFALREVNLNDILNNVLKDFELLISEKKAVINVSELPVIEGIPLHINQLFYNLLNNSLKFHQPGKSPVIDITYNELSSTALKKFPSLDPDLNYIEISITDNGIGFNQEYAEQIFLIFERLHNQSEYAGTGIGLALCQKIVSIHKGEIHVKSKENKGTTFFIILPQTQGQKR